MTEKQKKFIMEYASCANATESALKAGYSKKTAYSIGQRLLKNVEIQQEIKGSLSKALAGAAKGAVAGATVGRLIPVIGPVVGAAVGAVLGFLGGLVD